MKYGTIAILLLALCLGGAAAQTPPYRFSIPKAEVTVTIEPEGSAVIHYKLTFTCSPGAHPIDVVDIGMPNLAPHSPGGASINGRPIPAANIKVSTYLKPKGCGYEIHLANMAIVPGNTGVFEFTAREKSMVWQDLTDPDQASFRFTPTWFGKEYVVGPTELMLRCKLPIPKAEYDAVKDRILWQKEGQDFSAKGVMKNEDAASAAWVRQVSFTGPNEFGLSFPKRFVNAVREDSIIALIHRWFKGKTDVRILAAIPVLFLFAFIFFPLTGGTGCSLFAVLEVMLVIGMIRSPAFHLALFPVFAVSGFCVLIWRLVRKKRYFPAQFCREGGGIGRGLGPVEAAVLLELSLQKILTIIIFELARKGIIEIHSQEPLMIGLVDDARKNAPRSPHSGHTRPASAYESAFIRAFQKQANKPVEEMDLRKPFTVLINRVAKLMKGCDAETTRKYYRSMVESTWMRVRNEVGVEARIRQVDDNLGWLMLDQWWPRKMKKLEDQYPYRPTWFYRSFGGGCRPHGRISSSPTVVMPGYSETTEINASFSDVTTALTGRFDTFCNQLQDTLNAANITSNGAVDLSGIDALATDVLDTISKESQGGGGGYHGGGGGCACACAGCACACACAGGGR